MPLAVILFTLSSVVRIAFMVAFHIYRDLSRVELERTALSLAYYGVYGNPYAVPTGPTAHVSPGYTVILAGLFRVFGDNIPGEIVKQTLAILVFSLGVALLPWAATQFKLDRRAGIAAALLLALYPARPLAEIQGDWETPYTALALLFVSVATVRLWRATDISDRTAALYGLLWGISLLFVSALLSLFAALLLLIVAFARQFTMKKRLRFAGIVLVVAAACLSPWVIRNRRALGAPIVTRSNFGLELRLSNNDQATPDQRINYVGGLFGVYHPLLSVSEALKVRKLGEVQYNAQAMMEAKQWIRAHPGRFALLTLGRIRCFWLYTDPTSPVKTVVLALTVLLGFAGWPLVFKSNRETAIVLGTVLLIFPLPNYLVHVALRQEIPVHWMMALLGSNLLVELARQRYSAKRPGNTPEAYMEFQRAESRGWVE